jgi:hypothetical protein
LIVKNTLFATMEFSRCTRASRLAEREEPRQESRPGLSKLSSEVMPRRGRR